MQQMLTATNCDGLCFNGTSAKFGSGNNAVSFIWRSEYGWPVSHVSENIEQFGYKPEDFLSNELSYEDIIHPGDVIRVRKALLEHSEKSSAPFVQEYRIMTFDGRIRWVCEETSFVYDEFGQVQYLKGDIRDITGIAMLKDILPFDEISKADLTYNERPADVADKVIDIAGNIENIDAGAIYFLDEVKGGLQLYSCFGFSDTFLSRGSYHNPGSALVHFANRGLPAYKHYSDIYTLISRKNQNYEDLQATAVIPVHHEDRFIGLFIAASTKENFFPEDIREKLASIALIAGILMNDLPFSHKNH